MLTFVQYFIAFSAVFSSVFSENYGPHCDFGKKKSNTTCSKQLLAQNLTDDDCFIGAFFPNGQVCREIEFQINGRNDLGEVKLIPFVQMDKLIGSVRTILNLTFVGVKWNYLKFQWKERDGDKKAFCRNFVLSGNINLASDVSLFYDCPWLTSDDELHEFDFKYEARNLETGRIEGKYYIFQLPSQRSIDPTITSREIWKVFAYLDISALPILTVHWQQPPQHIGAKYYQVRLMNNETSKILNTITVAADPRSSQQSVDFNGQGLTGSVFVVIKPIFGNNTEGSESRTPIVTLVPKASYFALYLMVFVFIFVVISLGIMFCWLQSRNKGDLPIVLILYKHARNSHMNALVAFTKCLKEITQAKILLHELDIPFSETKDPFLWYHEAFALAEYILVVAPPSVPAAYEEGIYPHVDTVGLRLLAENYCDESCRKKYFSVVFPYCKDSDIPREAMNFKRFRLMNDFNELVWYITHKVHHSPVLQPVYSAFSLCGKNVNVKDHCKPLLESFRAASNDLKTAVSGNFEKQTWNSDVVLTQLETVHPCGEVAYVPNIAPVEFDDDVECLFPGNIAELNLLGTPEEEPKHKSNIDSEPMFDIHDLLQ